MTECVLCLFSGNVHIICYVCTGLNSLLSSLIGGGNLGNTAADRGTEVGVVF